MIRFQFALLVVLAAAAPAAAAPKPKLNPDVWIGWGNLYRPMEWTPIEITVHHKYTKPVDAYLTLTVQQDELTEVTVRHDFVLTPNLPEFIPLATKIAPEADEVRLAIHAKGGGTLWRRGFQVGGMGVPQPIEDSDLLIAVRGRGKQNGLISLPGLTHCPPRKQRGKVHLKLGFADKLPWDWTGYASLDLLILNDPDWSRIRPEQAEAIAQWVSKGGKLLVILGARPLPAKHPLARLLPCTVGGAAETKLHPDAFGRWTAEAWVKMSSSAPHGTIDRWAADLARDAKITAWRLTGRPGVRLRRHYAGGVGDAYVSAARGFGTVGVLAYDPSALGITQSRLQAKFWVRHVTELLGDNKRTGRTIAMGKPKEADDSEADGSYPPYEEMNQTGTAVRGANAIMNHLMMIPELKPLHIGWVIAVLALLALLLGPVDYLVLKFLDRQPLTWVTSAATIAVFTAGAYYGVQKLRSGTMQVRVVSVVDAVQGQGHAWRTSYAGLFAPDSDDYRLRDLQAGQWWSTISPTQEDDRWSSGRPRQATRRMGCVQADGKNLPVSVPINIWSMQLLVNEQRVDGVPFEAEVAREGPQIAVRIRNLADVPIRRWTVRLADGSLRGNSRVPAGGTVVVRERPRNASDWRDVMGDRDLSFRRERETAYFALGSLRRTEGIEALLARGAAVVRVEYDRAPVSFSLVNRDCTYDHVQLARLVVFPKERLDHD